MVFYLDFPLKVEACCRFLWLHGEVMYCRGNRVTGCLNLEGYFLWIYLKIRRGIIGYIEILLNVTSLNPNLCRTLVLSIIVGELNVLVDFECDSMILHCI